MWLTLYHQSVYIVIEHNYVLLGFFVFPLIIVFSDESGHADGVSSIQQNPSLIEFVGWNELNLC